MKLLVSVCCSALALAGCGTAVQFAATSPSPHPYVPRSPEEVALIASGTPERAYAELGILQARQESRFSTHSLADVLHEMRTRAGAIGCDAVIIQGRADGVDGDRHGTFTLDGVYGTCIVWLDNNS
ncbi:MAG: hypothetical protein AAGF12_10320 [Myxococcota bacterium]